MTNNIILVTVDSLRSDFIGHLNDGRDSTPRIDQIADNGIFCTNAYANGIPTYFAFRSILGGRRDIAEKAPIGVAKTSSTVADVFSENGYDTAAFNAANPWLTSGFNYDSGFDTFVDYLEQGSGNSIGESIVEGMKNIQNLIPEYASLRDKLGLAARVFCTLTDNYPIKSADVVTDDALNWLGNRSSDQPFFLWIHYMDPHYPWTPSSTSASDLHIARIWHKVAHKYNQSEDEPNKSTVEDVKRLYSDEVRSIDTAVGRLLDHLEQNNMKDDTVFCLTSDHGTELGDHGGFSHGPSSLYEEIIHVPLVISGPDVPTQTVTQPIQHVDIPPTLIDTAGLDMAIPEIKYGWAGSSLIRSQRKAALLQVIYDYNPAVETTAQTDVLNAIIEYPWKLHWNEESSSVELYNLDSDPHEMNDLSGKMPEKVDTLKKRIHDEQEDIQLEYQTVKEISKIREQIAQIDML